MIFQSEVVVQKVSSKRIQPEGLELNILICGFVGKSTEEEKYIQRLKAVPGSVVSEDYLLETIEFNNKHSIRFKIELDFPVDLIGLRLLSFKIERLKTQSSWSCLFLLEGAYLYNSIRDLDYNRKFKFGLSRQDGG